MDGQTDEPKNIMLPMRKDRTEKRAKSEAYDHEGGNGERE